MQNEVKLYAVRDNVNGTFERIESAISDDVIMRQYKYLLSMPEFDFKRKNVNDYDIYCLGRFNYAEGQIIEEDKILVCRLADLVKEKKDGKN